MISSLFYGILYSIAIYMADFACQVQEEKDMIDFVNPNEQPAEEELDNIITLNDENGNPVDFEFLDFIPYEDNDYVILAPMDSQEIVILRAEEGDPDSEEDTFYSVTDETVLNAVFDLFKERFKDIFTFED